MALHRLSPAGPVIHCKKESLNTIMFNKDDCLKETLNSRQMYQQRKKWKLGGPLIEREVKKGRLWLVSKP